MTYSVSLLKSASDRCPGNLIVSVLQSLQLVVWVKIRVGIKLEMHGGLVGENTPLQPCPKPQPPPSVDCTRAMGFIKLFAHGHFFDEDRVKTETCIHGEKS